MIEPALTYVVRRGVQEADAAKAKAIIFVMDTPGGTLDAASDIIRLIERAPMPTYTFVEKDAYSAGAIIAMATKTIYMAPGSVIGAATPMMMSPMGGAPENLPEKIEEKMISAVAAQIRAAAEQGGHDTQLAEKMVRSDGEYRIDDVVVAASNRLLTLTNQEAEREVGPDKRKLLSSGTVKNVDDLLLRIGLAGAEKRELQVTSAERMARWIAALSPLFLMAGLLGIYLEIKTPGVSLPGILGVMALLLFFWGHHIAGLAGMEDMLLFVIGVVLLLVEIFILPGHGIFGVMGGALIFWALLSAMAEKLPGDPWYPTMPALQGPLLNLSIGIISGAVLAVLLGRFLPRVGPVNRLVLAQANTRSLGYAASDDSNNLMGLTGKAQSELRPAGAAIFGDRRLDVVTRGEFIKAGQPVRIVETHGNHIVVERDGDGTT